MVDTDPIFASEDTFTQSNSSDPIAGLQESPVNEFQHSSTVATTNKLGHVKGGGNITIDPDGTMRAPVPVDPSWNNISGKPETFPPSAHSHSWSSVTDKPITFPPTAHTHSEYQRKELRLKQQISLPSVVPSAISVRQNSNSIKVAVVVANITKIIEFDFNYNQISSTNIATVDGLISEYIPDTDEFWVVTAVGTLIYRINVSTNTLIGTITIPSANVARNQLMYYKSMVFTTIGSLANLLILNVNTLVQTTKELSASYTVRTIWPFTHKNIDYVVFLTNAGGGALDLSTMNLVQLSTNGTNVFTGILYQNNKLIYGNTGVGGCYYADLTNWPEQQPAPYIFDKRNFFDYRKIDETNIVMISRLGYQPCLYISNQLGDIISACNHSLYPAQIGQYYPNIHLCVHDYTGNIIVLNKHSYNGTYYSLTFYKHE